MVYLLIAEVIIIKALLFQLYSKAYNDYSWSYL